MVSIWRSQRNNCYKSTVKERYPKFDPEILLLFATMKQLIGLRAQRRREVFDQDEVRILAIFSEDFLS